MKNHFSTFVFSSVLIICCFVVKAQTHHWSTYGLYEKKGKYGFIAKYDDPKSEKLTEPIFEAAEPFYKNKGPFTSVGKDCIKLKDGNLHCNKFAIINDKFEFVTDYEFQAVGFSDMCFLYNEDKQCDRLKNVALVLKDGKAGLFDLVNRKYILPPIATDFKMRKPSYNDRVYSEGRFIIYQIENKKWGVLDIEGNEICKPELDEVVPVIKGDKCCLNSEIVTIKKDEKWGLAHYKHGILLQPIYDEIRYYNDFECITVKKDGKIGAGNTTKGITIPPVYDQLWNYWEYNNLNNQKTEITGLANFVMAKKDDKEVLLHVGTGAEISKEVYTNAVNIIGTGDYIITANGDKKGAYSTSASRMALPHKYDEIQQGWIRDGCKTFIVKEGNRYFIVDEDNNLIGNRTFDKQFVADPKYKNYTTTFGLCDALCDSIFYLNDECTLTSSYVQKVNPSNQTYIKSSLEMEVDKLGEDINKRLQQLKQEKCSCCNGTGKDRNTATTYKTCFKCSGKGYTVWNNREWNSATGNQYSQQTGRCDRCGGTGKEVDTEKALPCSCCKGSGIRGY